MKMRCDRVFLDYFTRGRDGVLRLKARSQCEIFVVRMLSDLSASTETHLQLLPLKLKIVGKELCKV